MTRKIPIALTGLLVAVAVAFAGPRIDDSLFVAARTALPQDITTNELVSAMSAGLWNSNRTAVAIAIAKPKASLIFVFLLQSNGQFRAVNVSRVEGGNFGKLGTAGRAGYDRFETIPAEWLSRADGLFQVVMRTRAWKSGKRYTVSEPLLVQADGTVLWR